ncbi:MAG: hypothetical protein KDC47_07535 [Flavobacteriaceae bacterium]|nr:hypothetical protein [Flavobacteriaceae bacterium]
MMQFYFDGEFYKAIKVTGPAHNLLGISICSSNNGDQSIEHASLGSEVETIKNMTFHEVKEQVIDGLQEINNSLGTSYIIDKIQFLQSDSTSETIYKELTIAIIKRLFEGGEFKNIRS